MMVWILAAASLAPSPGPTEPPTEAVVAVEAAAMGSTFVVDGGDLEHGSLAASAAAIRQAAPATPSQRPMAFEYSEGYRIRRKIHKYASFATLPLFVAEAAVGQKLYDDRNASDATRSAHAALAAGVGVLFTVNTVTGVWNLSEGRKDPNHRTKRMVHGILMFVADAGFVATGFLAPESEHERGDLFAGNDNSSQRSTHRTVALASMGVATVSYLIMLIGH